MVTNIVLSDLPRWTFARLMPLCSAVLILGFSFDFAPAS